MKDWILDTFEEKTLPAEWTANTYYYEKKTLTADGAILAGLSATISPYVVASKQKRWRGAYYYNEQSAEQQTDNVAVEIVDKLWVPSANTVLLLDVNVTKAGSSITVEAVNASTMGYITGTVGTISDTVTQLI